LGHLADRGSVQGQLSGQRGEQAGNARHPRAGSGQAAPAMRRAEAGVAHASWASGAVKRGGVELASSRLGSAWDSFVMCVDCKLSLDVRAPIARRARCRAARLLKSAPSGRHSAPSSDVVARPDLGRKSCDLNEQHWCEPFRIWCNSTAACACCDSSYQGSAGARRVYEYVARWGEGVYSLGFGPAMLVPK
jgi:hypothetical protein